MSILGTLILLAGITGLVYYGTIFIAQADWTIGYVVYDFLQIVSPPLAKYLDQAFLTTRAWIMLLVSIGLVWLGARLRTSRHRYR